MKKRITSLLLCLCMVLTVFSGMTVIQASAAASLEGTSFFAYDVQRSSHNTENGKYIKTSGAQYPYISDNTKADFNDDNWTLHYVGSYGTFKSSLSDDEKTKLAKVVEQDPMVTALYDAGSADDVFIYELKYNSTTHVTYGVLVANYLASDNTNRYATFIGAIRNGNGNYATGYQLRTKSANIGSSGTVDDIPAVKSVASRSISLSESGAYTFPERQEGYTAPSLTITVTNNGGIATGALKAELGGTNSDKFTLTPTEFDSLEPNDTVKFYVAPQSGLDVGTYEATVTVGPADGNSIAEQRFNITFMVKHNLTRHEEVPATCTTAGNIEYWECSSCHRLFSDEDGQNEITGDVTTPIADHTVGSDGYTCMVCENMVFDYAYDVRRYKQSGFGYLSYPEPGQNVNLSIQESISNSTTDKWTLKYAGTYAAYSSAGNDNLNDLVDGFAESYGLSDTQKNLVQIYELKLGETHKSFGILMAKGDGYAAFIGDTRPGDGAGYLLSTTERSENLLVTALPTITGYEISLKQGDALITNDGVDLGSVHLETSSASNAAAITIKNTGKYATGPLTATLSGANADKFDLKQGDTVVSSIEITDIAVGQDAAFTVVPKGPFDSAGIYTATVTISGETVIAQSFKVKYEVTGHSYINDWKFDNTCHWYECQNAGCTVKANVSPHRFGENRVCSCGYTCPISIVGGLDGQSVLHYQINFGTRNVGYSDTPEAVTITVENNGSEVFSDLSVVLNNGAASGFKLSVNISSIAANGGTAAFTIQPKDSLAAAAYTDTVYIKAGDTEYFKIVVSFTVTNNSGGSGGFIPTNPIEPSKPVEPKIVDHFATTIGQFKDVAYFGRKAREGDVVLLKVSNTDEADRLGLDYHDIRVEYEVEGCTMVRDNIDYHGDPLYKDGIAAEFKLAKGLNKVTATVYYKDVCAGTFQLFYCYI